MIVVKRFTFEAAHYLPSYRGKCENLHGHSYRVLVAVEGEPDEEGMVIDFALLKAIVKEEALDRLDHCLLNELIPIPSAEHIARYLWQRLAPALAGPNYQLREVQVWETEDNGCIYQGERQ